MGRSVWVGTIIEEGMQVNDVWMRRKLAEYLVLILEVPSYLCVGLHLEIVCEHLHGVDAVGVGDSPLDALCPQDNPLLPTVMNETQLKAK